MKNNVKTLLRQLGYTLTADDDWLIEYLLDEVRRDILIFCNIDVIPDAASHICTRRTVGRFLTVKFVGNDLGDGFDFEGAITQIKEGDVSVSYGQCINTKDVFLHAITAMRTYGQEELICYRKMRW